MSRDLELDIALTHLICPVCAGKTDEHIVMDTRLKTPREGTPMHDKIHGKATGISKLMCDKCRQQLNDTDPAAIYLVEFDESKTGEEGLKDGNVYRTGKVIAVKHEAFERWFNVPPPENQWGYTAYPIVTNLMENHQKQLNNE